MIRNDQNLCGIQDEDENSAKKNLENILLIFMISASDELLQEISIDQ